MGPLFRIHDNAKLILRWLLIIVPISVAVGSVVALFLWLLDLAALTCGEYSWLLCLLPENRGTSVIYLHIKIYVLCDLYAT